MGNLFKPKVASLPPQPPPAEVIDYIDKVNNVSKKIVTGPDGKKTLVSERIALSPEEQALEDKYKQLQTTNLSRFEQLSGSGWMEAVPEAKAAMDAYMTSNKIGIDSGFQQAAQGLETNLARFGVADSTAAAQARTGLSGQYGGALDQLGRDTFQFGQQIRQGEQNNALTGFNIGAQRGDVLNNQLMGSFNAATQNQSYLAGLDQQRNMSIYNANLNDQMQRTNASAAGKKAFGDLLGAAIGAGATFSAA